MSALLLPDLRNSEVEVPMRTTTSIRELDAGTNPSTITRWETKYNHQQKYWPTFISHEQKNKQYIPGNAVALPADET